MTEKFLKLSFATKFNRLPFMLRSIGPVYCSLSPLDRSPSKLYLSYVCLSVILLFYILFISHSNVLCFLFLYSSFLFRWLKPRRNFLLLWRLRWGKLLLCLSADLPSSLLEEPNRTRLHVYKHFQLNPNLFNLLQFLNVTTFFYFLLSLFSFKTKIEREVGFCFFWANNC